jgi:nucleoside-diphosphate-sugar epimerase
MTNYKVLLTGATGFLGSHIAEHLVCNNIEVIALKREQSDFWRCKAFFDKIEWIDIDSLGIWREDVMRKSPTIIIHSAWIGVEAEERGDLKIQTENLNFLVDLLELGKHLNVKKFIGLGSQAEYGLLNKIVSEDEMTNPNSMYGAVKVASQQIVKTFCELNQINWIWLRLFSFVGERENNKWLIPSLFNAILNCKSIDMSPGEQKYSYMYVRDFAKIVLKIISSKISSGIYNLSTESSISIKKMASIIEKYTSKQPQLNWGVLPYRAGQSMLLQGNINKLKKEIGEIDFLSIEDIIKMLANDLNNQT